MQEVEDSLVQEKYQVKRIKHLEEQVRLAGEASSQLREQYLIGDAEYLDVLSAITGQQSLQRQLLSAQLELRLIRVSLYLALAGGFDPEQCDHATGPDSFTLESAIETTTPSQRDDSQTEIDEPTKDTGQVIETLPLDMDTND